MTITYRDIIALFFEKSNPCAHVILLSKKLATRLRLPALALCPRACVCSASPKCIPKSLRSKPCGLANARFRLPASPSPHRPRRIALALRHRRRSPPVRSLFYRFAFGRPFSPLPIPRHVWRRREERNALIYIKEREKLFTFRKSTGFKKISPECYANKCVHRENCTL